MNASTCKAAPPAPGESCPAMMMLKVITAIIAPMGSMKMDSHLRIDPTRRLGRAVRRIGPTTVGPDTTRMDPSSTAVARPRSVNAHAVSAPIAQVTATPTVTSDQMIRCDPSISRRRSDNPPSKRMTPTAMETTGLSSSPNMAVGSTTPRPGPTTSPTASNVRMDGMRSRSASQLAATAATTRPGMANMGPGTATSAEGTARHAT